MSLWFALLQWFYQNYPHFTFRLVPQKWIYIKNDIKTAYCQNIAGFMGVGRGSLDWDTDPVSLPVQKKMIPLFFLSFSWNLLVLNSPFVLVVWLVSSFEFTNGYRHDQDRQNLNSLSLSWQTCHLFSSTHCSRLPICQNTKTNLLKQFNYHRDFQKTSSWQTKSECFTFP